MLFMTMYSVIDHKLPVNYKAIFAYFAAHLIPFTKEFDDHFYFLHEKKTFVYQRQNSFLKALSTRIWNKLNNIEKTADFFLAGHLDPVQTALWNGKLIDHSEQRTFKFILFCLSRTL
jgi:hypothetical protein